ncbi:pimeloyl-ACP methyl ester esterase BioJ [Pseudofrancisella aestuarii]|uniref:Pimeloyl-ACP methyl ester esterase BioJ n=1 Tax=Pseudofrancisella aestuarii TaxID=2670347 RepID=A0ABV9TA73_9GAMM|nr:alpha/beta hydrolase [Pseudofrancisella aestuarii]
MSYHPALAELFDNPEMRHLKKLDLRIQREEFKKLSLAAMENLKKPNIKEEDIRLENDTILRHYQSKKPSNKAVLFIHGGGWALNSIDTYDHICRYLCDNGDFDIFSLEYGLAPEHKYPTAVNQSLYAYDWLYENAKKFSFAKENIFVMGDSAGGNLATIICHERQDNMPKAQILVYPAADMYTQYESIKKFGEHKYHLTSEWCELFLNAYLENKRQLKEPTCSPIFYKNTKQPDTLIIAATHDMLIDGIYAYEKKLKDEGVYVETHYDNEMYHGFISMIGMAPFENPKIALDKAIKFINER